MDRPTISTAVAFVLLMWSFPSTPAVLGQDSYPRDHAKLIAELRAKIAKLDQILSREGDEPREQIELQRQAAITELINVLRDAPNLTRQEDHKVLVRLLDETIETRGLQEPVKLKTALEYFSDKFGGRMPILIDRTAFRVDAGPNDPDPYEEEVKLPPVPTKMPMSTALRLVLAQVGNGKATFQIRQGFIEITTLKAGAAVHHLYQPAILQTFKQQPLSDVLDQLSDETGLAIHLDPKVGDKAKTPISARFRNSSLEDALIVVTEMAELKFVVLERSVFVTTPERATTLRKEEKERESHRREIAPKLMPPAKDLQPGA